MTVRGRAKNGVVVLNKSAKLPEGATVVVHLLAKKPKKATKRRSLTERLAAVIGKAKNVPPDASMNIDHYLYGTPKRK